ncbi:putative membrane protein [Erwinia phage pEa_SNUABM_50]|uniref:Uncharacterized protein n=4 Tax=Eneladusvirus BF TaxID=2560751 RepID=A0A1S6UBI0_9CAUD|nr:hypothetical protein FDH34_gp383 [Serratia phage BF]AQW89062.1 hypothetical protein BF_0537 [Serratia phage BF]QOI71412.1 putative membrane protein [Erwinia phage pEa_SNUABM_12]QOI72011.1 putative membrane protein [Erwinia phage pEa_SNUABM_47]QOI72551.1 putative membrane protein [Erwinia phage pEa_SNUABM_50]
MQEDIIVEVAKRTIVEIKEQVLSTPFVAAPFAVYGLIASSFFATFICILAIIGFVAYQEYKQYEEELLAGNLEVPNKVDPIETEVQKQADTESTDQK